MAIARGAGTEILRSQLFEAQDNSPVQIIINGAQHHIYTVISCVFHSAQVATDRNWIRMRFEGYDAKAGTSQATMDIFVQDMSALQTFVWNDKFSFNGFEPVDFSGSVDSEAKQDAIADQGSGVAQVLKYDTEASGDNCDLVCTFLDQNNA